MPPLARVVSDDQGARVLRQSRESGLMIPSGGRLREPINDPADLLRRLHQGSLAQPTTARNRAEDSRRPERQRRELREGSLRLTARETPGSERIPLMDERGA